MAESLKMVELPEGLWFNVDSGELWRHGSRVPLQHQPARVLDLLIARRGKLVPRDEIKQLLWPAGHIDENQAVNFCIHRLRAALGDDPSRPTFIETVPKRGYRFVGDVDASPSGRGRRRLRSSLVRFAALLLLPLAGHGVVGPDPGPLRPVNDALARARYLLDRGTQEGYRGALKQLKRGILLEPTSPVVQARRSEALFCLRMIGERWAEAGARESAGLSMRFGPREAEAQLSIARIRMFFDGDSQGAARAIKRAVEIDPNDGRARVLSAFNMLSLGRPAAAIAEARAALRLDPVAAAIRSDVAWVFFLARDYHSAIREAALALELDSSLAGMRLVQLLAHQLGGDERRAAELASGFLAEAGARVTELDSGTSLDRFWRWRVDQLSRGRAPGGALVIAYASLGDRESALAALRAARAAHSALELLPFLDVHPGLDPLRADPRFLGLVERTRPLPNRMWHATRRHDRS